MQKTALAVATACMLALDALPVAADTIDTGSPTAADLVSAAVPLDPGSQASVADLRGQDLPAGATRRIAFVPVAPAFTYYASMADGVEAEARQAGIDVVITGPPGSGDNRAHVEILEQIVDRSDVHGLIVAVRDAELAAPVLRRAVEAGIVVVVANSDLRTFPTPIHAVVGYSQYAANRAMGDYAGRITADRPTRVGVIEGAPGYHSTEAVAGFRDGLTEHDHLTVVASRSGGWSVDGGRTAAEALLRDHPGIELIWAANDNMIIGARQAAEAAGRSDLILLGRDGDPVALQMVAEGGLTATNDTDPTAIGAASARVVVQALAGRFDGGFVETPTVVVDAAIAAAHPATD